MKVKSRRERGAKRTRRPRFNPASDLLEDRLLLSVELTEGNAAQWGSFAPVDHAATVVTDDTTYVKEGGSSIHLRTESGFDTGVVYPKTNDADWDLTTSNFLVFWSRTDNPYTFQGNQPIVVLNASGGKITLTPQHVLTPNQGWEYFFVPLAGSSEWVRSTTGTPDLHHVNSVEIHQDTWDHGFDVYYDGMRFIQLDAQPGPAPPAGVNPDVIQPRVLLYVFDPILENRGGRRTHEVYGWADPVALTTQAINDLRSSSHGMLDYQIVDTVIADVHPYYDDGTQWDDATFTANWEANPRVFPQGHFDYVRFVLENDIAARVNSGDIDEVWIYTSPEGGTYESVMAGPGAFWINGPTQNVPSERVFPIMGLNYERGVGEAIHSFGHRVEGTMDFRYGVQSPNLTNNWNKFTYQDRYSPGAGNGGVGNTHFPVNAASDYDYDNAAFVMSNADDWANYPNFQGEKRLINAREWSPTHADPQREYLNWWYSHMPHFASVGPDGFLNNWWRYIGDLDQFKSGARGQLGGSVGVAQAWIRGLEPGSVVAGVTPLKAEAVTDGALGRVDFYVDGTFIGTDTLAPYTVPWDTTGWAPGDHVIVAKAYELQHQAEFVSDPITVTIRQPVAVESSPLRSTYGQPVSFTATVAGIAGEPTPTGAVQFYVDGVKFGGPVNLVNGAATSAAIQGLAAGGHAVTASYLGDGRYPADSGGLLHEVDKALLTLTADSKTRFLGQTNPALTFRFTGFVNGETTSAITGAPVLTTTATLASGVGVYPIVATAGALAAANYDFNLIGGQLSITKIDAILKITPSAIPRALGDPLSFTIDAIPAIPTASLPNGGRISIHVGPYNFGGVMHNGRAVFQIPYLEPQGKAGTYEVAADYDGTNDPIFGSATATTIQVVTLSSPTIVGELPASPVPTGKPVTLRAVLNFPGLGSITPSGGVMLNDFGQPIAISQIALVGGQWVATFTLNSLTAGLHRFRFVYLGEKMAYPAASPAPQDLYVGTAGAGGGVFGSSSSGGDGSPNPGASAPPPGGSFSPAAAVPPVGQTVYAGTPAMFTAAPSNAGNTSAQWQVSVGGGAWTNIPNAANWWYSFTPTAADSGNRYRVVFSGSGEPETSAPATLTVNKVGAILTITPSANPRALGDPLSFTVDASSAIPGVGVPDGGRISIHVGPHNFGGVLRNGRAVFQIPYLEPQGKAGAHAVAADYDGTNDPIFGSAMVTTAEVVTLATTSIRGELPASPTPAGHPVTLRAVLSFAGLGSIAPSGGVMLNDFGQPIAISQIALVGGQWVATFTLNSLTPGLHRFRFIYLGEKMAYAAASPAPQDLVVGGSSIAGFLGGGSAFSASAIAPPPKTASAPPADLAGAVASLAIDEASNRKPASRLLASANGAPVSSPPRALPNALTARQLQQWRPIVRESLQPRFLTGGLRGWG